MTDLFAGFQNRIATFDKLDDNCFNPLSISSFYAKQVILKDLFIVGKYNDTLVGMVQT